MIKIGGMIGMVYNVPIVNLKKLRNVILISIHIERILKRYKNMNVRNVGWSSGNE